MSTRSCLAIIGSGLFRVELWPKVQGNVRNPKPSEYLMSAVGSLSKSLTAFEAYKASRGLSSPPSTTEDPMSEALLHTMDALMQSVIAFVYALKESEKAQILIDGPEFHKLFEPAVIRRELLLAGQFLMAWEFLMASVIRRLRHSYVPREDSDEARQGEERYRREVLDLERSELWASCEWLKRHGVLGDDDIKVIDNIRRRRNHVAHTIPAMLVSEEWLVPEEHFKQVAFLVAKIDLWWLSRSGSDKPRSFEMMMFEYLLQVAGIDLGPDSPLGGRAPAGSS